MSGMPSDADYERIKDLIFSGNKIGAIKAYRQTMGVDLANAKTGVEELTAELRESTPERFQEPTGKGCARVTLFVVAFACLASWLLSH